MVEFQDVPYIMNLDVYKGRPAFYSSLNLS
jgi:hypothetical protein